MDERVIKKPNLFGSLNDNDSEAIFLDFKKVNLGTNKGKNQEYFNKLDPYKNGFYQHLLVE